VAKFKYLATTVTSKITVTNVLKVDQIRGIFATYLFRTRLPVSYLKSWRLN